MRKRTAKAEMNLQLWMERIQRCRNSELTITAFCEQEGIHSKSYYYWLNKIRKLAIEELPEPFPMPDPPEANQMSHFVEFPVLLPQEEAAASDKVELKVGPVQIQFSAALPAESIQAIVQAVLSHAR